MIKEAYELISKIEKEIGDSCTVFLRIPDHEPVLTVRIEWDIERTILRYERSLSMVAVEHSLSVEDTLIQVLVHQAKGYFETSRDKFRRVEP